ncbi:hypothetical protein ACKC5O_19340 [Aeromonas schubertii]|uniref:hypothetical protein n=1 Tax=Aeromonas schubertii TaxID=652 RepID=UPI0038B4E69C
MNIIKKILVCLIFIYSIASAAEPIVEPEAQTLESSGPVKGAVIEPELPKSTTLTTAQRVTIAKDTANILFFIAMATVGVLSYRQAKKTVFSPIKTEIFKYQLEVFEDVIRHFQNKGEYELKSDMDIDTIIDINSFELVNSYVETFMKGEIQVNEDAKKEKMAKAKGAIVSQEYAQEYFEVLGVDKPVEHKKDEPKDPALKLSVWNERKYGLVHFTEKYDQSVKEIQRFQDSPLLPSDLKKLLSDYSMLMHKTLSTVGETMEEVGKEMPKSFRTKESITQFSVGWVSNLHNDRTPKLEPKAKEILEYINKYLGIDNLAKSNI